MADVQRCGLVKMNLRGKMDCIGMDGGGYMAEILVRSIKYMGKF